MSYGILTHPAFVRPNGMAKNVFTAVRRFGVAGLTDYERGELRKLLAVRWSACPGATRKERQKWARELDDYEKRQRAHNNAIASS